MAATLLLRALGIPARYTVGVYSEVGVANEWIEVYSNTGHAWTEAYIDGVGWVALEVTGGDLQFPEPGDGSTPGGFGGGGAGGGAGGEDDKVTKIEIEPIVDPVLYYDGIVLTATKSNKRFTGNDKYRELLKAGYTFECEVEGSISKVGYGVVSITSVKMYGPDREDLTDSQDYKITTKDGRLHLYEKAIVVSSGSITSDYTGKYVTCETYDCSTLIDSSHYVEITFGSGRRDAGVSQNYFTCNIYQGVGADKKDVTYRYMINKNFGNITINTINIAITADKTQLTYDELVAMGGLYEASVYTLDGELFEGHRFEYVKQSGSLSGKGRQETIILEVKIVDQNGKDVTGNYYIAFKTGLIRVTR